MPGDIMPGERYLAATVKRLGEDWFFSGAFVVFAIFLLFFHVFCLVVKRKFVYLQTDSTEAEIRTYGR